MSLTQKPEKCFVCLNVILIPILTKVADKISNLTLLGWARGVDDTFASGWQMDDKNRGNMDSRHGGRYMRAVCTLYRALFLRTGSTRTCVDHWTGPTLCKKRPPLCGPSTYLVELAHSALSCMDRDHSIWTGSPVHSVWTRPLSHFVRTGTTLYYTECGPGIVWTKSSCPLRVCPFHTE